MRVLVEEYRGFGVVGKKSAHKIYTLHRERLSKSKHEHHVQQAKSQVAKTLVIVPPLILSGLGSRSNLQMSHLQSFLDERDGMRTRLVLRLRLEAAR